GSGGALAGADDRGDLGVREAGEELERDQLALAGRERRERRPQGGAPQRGVGGLLGGRGALVGRLRRELRAPAPPAQLVERGVAGDAEEPCAPRPPAGPIGPALAEGALEGLGGDVLGGGAIAEQPGHVGVDVVAALAVERLEGEVGLARRVAGRRCERLLHAPTTREARLHNTHGRRIGARQAAAASSPGAAAWADATAAAIESAVIATSRRRSAAEIESGGISTITSPSGRSTAPRRRASSTTRWPRRSAGSCSPRSMPTMKPRPRTSATSGIAATPASSSPRRRILGWRRSRVASRSNASRLASAAAQEGAVLLRRAQEGLVDPLRGQRGGEREVAAGEPLAEAEQIGRHALLLAGEHRARAAEARRDHVADQQHAVGA